MTEMEVAALSTPKWMKKPWNQQAAELPYDDSSQQSNDREREREYMIRTRPETRNPLALKAT